MLAPKDAKGRNGGRGAKKPKPGVLDCFWAPVQQCEWNEDEEGEGDGEGTTEPDVKRVVQGSDAVTPTVTLTPDARMYLVKNGPEAFELKYGSHLVIGYTLGAHTPHRIVGAGSMKVDRTILKRLPIYGCVGAWLLRLQRLCRKGWGRWGAMKACMLSAGNESRTHQKGSTTPARP